MVYGYGNGHTTENIYDEHVTTWLIYGPVEDVTRWYWERFIRYE